MAEEFIDDRIPSPIRQRDRETVRIIIVGSRRGITNVIHTLYAHEFAQIHEWSNPEPEINSGKLMSVMTRYLHLE
ncbi:hypothetical protein ACKFKH_24050 [Phormidesmis sp. 146-20]